MFPQPDGTSLYKIFSDERLSLDDGDNNNNNDLRSIFLPPVLIETQVEWNAAYPVLRPTMKKKKKKNNKKIVSTDFILTHGDASRKIPAVVYAGALEKYVSTMETQSISAMNAALLVKDILVERRRRPQQRQRSGDGGGDKRHEKEKNGNVNSDL